MEIITKYFPNLSDEQKDQFGKLGLLYEEWNSKINVVSRKDIPNLYERHILHSLAIAKFISFQSKSDVLDVGTGGGFPGIPLAIMFPETNFHLVDSIGKKIQVATEIADALGLKNVKAEHVRAEKGTKKYDFIVTRAVAKVDKVYHWVCQKIKTEQNHFLENGIICLKGGDLDEEFENFKHPHQFINVSEYFDEEFFETKKVVYVTP